MNCIERALIDSHFRGSIAPGDERRMRTHVTDCDACKVHYRKRQILAQLDPEAPSPEDRIAKALFATPARRRVPWPLIAGIVAAAAILLLFVRPKDDGFTPRGSVTSLPAEGIGVYRVQDHALVSTTNSLRADDELAFSYENPQHKPYLMIFGVDEGGRVYWFYPAWTNESENPSAVKTDPGAVTRRLPEAIKHPFAGSKLTIHGLFLDEPLTVREAEKALFENQLSGLNGAVDQQKTFEVAR
jgi:hypothetical protein